jgi:hypothetical protein
MRTCRPDGRRLPVRLRLGRARHRRRGRHQFDPSDATIRTSLGHSCPTSPCTVEVSRKSEFTAYAEKAGYKPGSHYLGTKMSGGGAAGMAGNILIGGVIGVGVDAVSGATLDHFPNLAHIMLEPVDSPNESMAVVKPATARKRPYGKPVREGGHAQRGAGLAIGRPPERVGGQHKGSERCYTHNWLPPSVRATSAPAPSMAIRIRPSTRLCMPGRSRTSTVRVIAVAAAALSAVTAAIEVRTRCDSMWTS